MNKMNKKGFTLIEMLVVIAIIAVLVSIIIPTVTSATDKAAAAANAANLRSFKAEMVTTLLTEGNTGEVRGITLGATSAKTDAEPSDVTFKDLGSTFTPSYPDTYSTTNTYADGSNFQYTIADNDEVTVWYDGLSINDWAALAGN